MAPNEDGERAERLTNTLLGAKDGGRHRQERAFGIDEFASHETTLSQYSCAAAVALETLQQIAITSPALKSRRRQISVPISMDTLYRDRRNELYIALNNSDVAKLVTKRNSPSEMFKMMSEFLFVAMPLGNGQDTYRLWEALHAGSIPVLLHGPLDIHAVPLHNYFEMVFHFLR